MSRKARQRTSRLPIRTQLMLPIAAALMGMLVLGLFQTVHVWGEYQDATDAAVLSDLAGSVADVLDGHQNEGSPVLEAVLTGSADEIDLAALRARHRRGRGGARRARPRPPASGSRDWTTASTR